MDINNEVSLLNIKEDLLDDEVSSFKINLKSEGVNSAAPNGKAKQTKSVRIKAEVSTYDKLLASAIKKIGCTTGELTTWLNQTPYTPEAAQLNALRLIAKHALDPFADELSIHRYEDGHWQAFITIDGWSRLINGHPAFSGISFTESTELVNGIPIWMGCAIYRNDRVVPIEVKEYLSEIQTEHSIWKDMPRRMLRYRVIVQCARLAFGVSVPELKKTFNNSQKIKSESKITVRVSSSRKKMLLEHLQN
ncbi:recombinase RecT [Polynucleobacter bastaniensis]|uniref:recombinase RecT n=1 Tax=Polynucleobacter bastaniensis TaxID=2081039 RepID=UPI001C0DAA07|nr:recombinase RecT [Polynucleobacter bastaniensis]MBU3598251.1 recombinase RecT [Polynucleobacter bastaniensis]